MAMPAFVEWACLGVIAAVIAALSIGLIRALARAHLDRRQKVRVWLGLSLSLLLWFGAIDALARLDLLKASEEVLIPGLPFALLPPILVGSFLMLRSKTMALIIDATPLSWLVGIQIYRVVGAIFLVLGARALLPDVFALPAGIGDIVVGVLAPLVALSLAMGWRSARRAALGWNALGLLDFVAALATGFLSSPGRFEILSMGRPNLYASAYPLVLIPAFLVPLSTLLHVLALWKLARSSEPADARALPARA